MEMYSHRAAEVVCKTAGSRPPAMITWYLNGRRIEGGSEEVSGRGRNKKGRSPNKKLVRCKKAGQTERDASLKLMPMSIASALRGRDDFD